MKPWSRQLQAFLFTLGILALTTLVICLARDVLEDNKRVAAAAAAISESDGSLKM